MLAAAPLPYAIRRVSDTDLDDVLFVIQEASVAYRGVIPADCWHEPYMDMRELKSGVDGGIRFWGCFSDDRLLGVMGIQEVLDVTLIRHAYVRTAERGCGIGGKLLQHLLSGTHRPVLIGTWAAAYWAIGFYQKHGFLRVDEARKAGLLRRYWGVPERQIETSVVLGDSVFHRGEAAGADGAGADGAGTDGAGAGLAARARPPSRGSA